MRSQLNFKGRFKLVHCDASGKVLGEYDLPNGITTEGLNHVLEAEFGGGAQVDPWYIGLIDATSGYTGLAAGDTAAEINGTNGWDELTDYTEATRVEWTEGAAAAGSITSSSTSDFSINATVSIKGIFVVSLNTKGGTTGTLWSTAAFAADVAAVNGDTLKITYTVSG